MGGEKLEFAPKERKWRERGWRSWLLPTSFDVVLSASYIGVLILFYIYNSQTSWFTAFFVTLVTLALLAIDRVEYWFFGEETPPNPAIGLLITRFGLIEIIARLDDFKFSPVLYFNLPYLATIYFGKRIGYWFYFGVLVIRLLRLEWDSYNPWYNEPDEVKYFIVWLVGMTFMITMTRVVIKERESRAQAEQLLRQLEESNRQLKAYAEQVAELSTTKERNRLAREIHDSLGHYLTVINIQLEKAQTFRLKEPEEADQAVSDAKRLAKEALRDVRHSVGTLRGQTQELFAFQPTLTTLVKNCRTPQLEVDLKVEGQEEGYSIQSLHTLYRAIQEGLTNIQKHAKASLVKISLTFGPEEALLLISDNGGGFDPELKMGNGYGLLGVEERLELVGGSLKIHSQPGIGTQLIIRLAKTTFKTIQVGLN